MYLKREFFGNRRRFLVCESYREGDCWKHRQLMNLGPNPGQYIVYPGGNSFHVDEALEETLQEKALSYDSDELEELFLPFLDPRIRRIVERFSKRNRSPSNRSRSDSYDDRLKRQRRLHPFDKRRIHYLRCGRIDMGDLDSRPLTFFHALHDKSRDEIEAMIDRMEPLLKAHEIQAYLFTALQVQTHFRHLLTRNQPAALDPEKVEEYFLHDLCLLNRDERFFRGVENHDPETIHPYLVKYVILFFDSALDTSSLRGDPGADFMARHRFYRKPGTAPPMSAKEMEDLKELGISSREFRRMDRSSFTRIYRRKAKEAHPDTGGKVEEFLRVTEAYERLLRRKS